MYKALNYWVFGGFDGQKTPYEFIDWAAEKGLDGVELTVGDALSPDITEEECRKIAKYAADKKIGLRSLATGAGWGCYLGAADSLIAVGVYVVLGLIGVPVFASGGGFDYVLKPSFGFTLGFLVSSLVCGLLYKKSTTNVRKILTLALGTISIYVVGIVYFLSLKVFYLGGAIDFWNVLLTFWIMFIPSDILKAAVCFVLLKRIPENIR